MTLSQQKEYDTDKNAYIGDLCTIGKEPNKWNQEGNSMFFVMSFLYILGIY